MIRPFFILLSFIFLCSSAYAFDIIGLKPSAPYGVFSTFSAESLPEQTFSLETGAEQSIEPDFSRFYLKGALGISDNLEFNFIIPYVYKFNDDLDGFEDISVGFKHRFYDEGRYGPSIAYLLHASFGTGRDDFSTSGRYGIGFILSKRIGPFRGHLNLIYAKPGSSDLEDEVTFNGGLEFSAAHNFTLLGEFLAKNSHYSDKYDLIEARLGCRIMTTEYIYTTLGTGFELSNRNPEFRFMLSVSFVVPQKKKVLKRIYEKE